MLATMLRRGVCEILMNRIVLYLVESESGPPLQYWSFSGETLLGIGRSIDNEIVILSPYVSRGHAYLSFENGGWSANAISELGVLHHGRKHTRLSLHHGMVFRLGPHGPMLKFSSDSAGDTEIETEQPGQSGATALTLDPVRLRSEVHAIAGTDFFQRLSQTAREIRQATPSPSTTL